MEVETFIPQFNKSSPAWRQNLEDGIDFSKPFPQSPLSTPQMRFCQAKYRSLVLYHLAVALRRKGAITDAKVTLLTFECDLN